MNDTRVAELLDELTPRYDDRAGDWERVAAEARVRRGRCMQASWRPRLAAIAAAVAAVAAVVLVWPFQAEQTGVLDRALAAIGEGPVLHAVLRGSWGGTLVDLESGKRSPVHGENEVWYDTEGGRVHSVSRLGDVVQHDQVYEPREPPPELVALGRDYRRALAAGTARVAGEATVGGEAVTWVTIRSERLPDVADGKDHEWAQQVAVSRRTSKPVALRETRDGEPGPGTTQRVLDLELLAAGEGDFTASTERNLDGTVFRQGREPIALDQAHATLGRTPVWLGRDYGGLPLAQAFKETTSSGRRSEVEVTGAEAKAALECRTLRGGEAARCIRRVAAGSSLAVRPDGVFRTDGPVVWSDELTALVLFYGSVGDDPSTSREDVMPLYDGPHLTITQTTERSPLQRGTGTFLPPEGSVFVAAGARIGVLQVDGLLVTIEAAGEEAILAAARALEPMGS